MRHIRFIALVFFLILILPAVSLTWGGLEDIRYKLKGSDGNLWSRFLGNGYVIRGEECPGTITFTFDDGPDHRTTPILLEQLDHYGIKAAFFINGARFHQRTAGGSENQSVLRETYRRGHFIGNHSYSHQDITALDDQGWRVEVLQVEQVIRGLIGRRPWVFRPPFGRVNRETLERLANEKYTVVMWNLNPLDWKSTSAEDLLLRSQRVIEENPLGGVFLLHDTNRVTIEAFPLIVEWIEERNARLRASGEKTLEIVGLEHYIRTKRR